MTRLVMTLLVRDEARIVAANLDYHLAHGVDFVVATDNGSVDGTREILAEYERKGVLVLLDEPGRDFMQDAWTTRMAHLAHDRFGADWVLSNDADEFWSADGGDLRTLVRDVPADVVRVRRVDLLPTVEQTALANYTFSRNVLRPAEGLVSARPKTAPKVLFRTSTLVSVEAGNHDVRASSSRRIDARDATIFHFPFRTYDEFETKVRNGGAALRQNAHWPASWGAHWRVWYAAYEDGTLPEVYRTLVPSDEYATLALKRGDFTRETRIAGWFRCLRSTEARS